jgi:hypothetical protein
MNNHVAAKPTYDDADLAGCCGLYCGLCPRYQSRAASRCPGCHAGDQRTYCSVCRCCAGKRDLTTCAECEEYPCERLLRVIGVGVGIDSFISHKPALPNLERIREAGLDVYLEEQRVRRLLVEDLLADYNDGRSMTFYCTACALMPVDPLRVALESASEDAVEGRVDATTRKARAKAMRAAIEKLAHEMEIDLRLTRKREEARIDLSERSTA